LTIQFLYDVQLPKIHDGVKVKGIFSCFKSSNNKYFSLDVSKLCTTKHLIEPKKKVPHIQFNDESWKQMLIDIRDHNKTKSKLYENFTPRYFGGGVKKVRKTQKTQPSRKVLGKNRKVYKIKGSGNTLYVKIMGKEMTLKAARVLDAKK
jgi:hypothetical protein